MRGGFFSERVLLKQRILPINCLNIFFNLYKNYYWIFRKYICHLADFIMCLKTPVCKEEKVHCCVCWVAHSAPGHSAAVTLSLNSASSLSDVDECVGDLKRLFFLPQLSEKAAHGPCRPATDRSGAGALRLTKRLALVTGAQKQSSIPNYEVFSLSEIQNR